MKSTIRIVLAFYGILIALILIDIAVQVRRTVTLYPDTVVSEWKVEV
ncbi:MAG: hypothetical protein KF889_01515 [Alphaproteobacteria bacterium]|nr:hypothetical protein [Alphaproteobacteria bacterium]MCW5741582.1 hypothetical protein [Alphaproteobacteria bacterium]